MDHAEPVVKPYSRSSAVIAVGLSCSRHFLAAPNHLLVAILATDQRRVDIHRSLIIATATMKPARNAHFSSRSDACAARSNSRISNVGFQMYDAARSAARSYAVALTSVGSLAIGRATAKMSMARPASSRVGRRRRPVTILIWRIHVTRLSLVRKTGPVRVRFSSPALVRRRSRR